MKDSSITKKAKLPQPEPAGRPKPDAELKLTEEFQKMPYEPLLPIEKKLVLWSVSLGLFLLGALIWASRTFFQG